MLSNIVDNYIFPYPPYRENRKLMYFTATTAPAQFLLLCPPRGGANLQSDQDT